MINVKEYMFAAFLPSVTNRKKMNGDVRASDKAHVRAEAERV
jgi:hypothetical protein